MEQVFSTETMFNEEVDEEENFNGTVGLAEDKERKKEKGKKISSMKYPKKIPDDNQN